MPNTVDVLDKQQNIVYPVNAKRALYLASNYHSRFRIQNPYQLRKELAAMARLAVKSPVLYQTKLTLETVKDEELICVSIEEKEGTSATYLLLRIKRPNNETGYINMGFEPIVQALKKLDWKKDLPGELKFTKSGSSWIMV